MGSYYSSQHVSLGCYKDSSERAMVWHALNQVINISHCNIRQWLSVFVPTTSLIQENMERVANAKMDEVELGLIPFIHSNEEQKNHLKQSVFSSIYKSLIR